VSKDCWKIADFGTASEATSKRFNTTRYARGTPCYRPPEVLDEDAKYNNKADIWSLGCIVYEISTGAKAFSSDWAVREFSSTNKLNLAVPWPEPDRAYLSILVEELGYHLFKMLSIDPSLRPKAEDLSDIFRSLVSVMTPRTTSNMTETRMDLFDDSSRNLVGHLFAKAAAIVDETRIQLQSPAQSSTALWPRTAWSWILSMIWGHRISRSDVLYTIRIPYALI
jgi:serine/threonine protein kinase